MSNTKNTPVSRRAAIVLLALLTGALALGAAPVVHWTFDLTEGEVQDVAGGCDGQLEGDWDADVVRPGIFGNAMLFDNGVRRVRVPHREDISLRDDFTIEVVIKPYRVTGFRTIFWKGNRTITPQQINYYVDLRDGRPEFKTKDAQGRWLVFSTPFTVSENEWHHIVMTFDGGNVKMVVNGTPRPVTISENGTHVKALVTNEADATLGDGANPRGSAYSFVGLIDEIRIYDGRVLDSITEDYDRRWRDLRENVRQREVAFEREQARRAEEARRQMRRDYDAMLEANATRPDVPVVCTVLPTSRRLDGAPDFFRSIQQISRVAECSAARNEYEGFQVILMGPRDAGPLEVSISVSELIRDDGEARIPTDNLSWGRIERVTTEKPDIPVPFVGAIPDVIVEDGAPVRVPPGDFGAAYCRIFTGNALPGRYAGQMTLSAKGFTETVHIELTVYDFELPARGSLRTACCFFEQFYRAWYGLETLTDARREAIYEFLLSYRLSPCNIYSPGEPFPPFEFLETYRDRITFFTVGRIGAKTEETARDDAAEKVALLRRIREAGLEEYMYFYSFDELAFNMDHLPAARRVSAAMRDAWPGLKMMQTSFPIPELQPLFNVWCPLWHEFGDPDRRQVVEDMRARGDRIWWYAADSPKHPYPNLFLDYPVFDCRIMGLLSYMYDVEGILYWCINREWRSNMDIREQWPDAQWKPYIFHFHTGKRKYKNGMGNLVYPGRHGTLYPSLRLENLRDGLEDYEYVAALETAIGWIKQAGIPDDHPLARQARELLTPPAEVATSIKTWSHDPSHLMTYRNEVARMIEKITVRLEANGTR